MQRAMKRFSIFMVTFITIGAGPFAWAQLGDTNQQLSSYRVAGLSESVMLKISERFEITKPDRAPGVYQIIVPTAQSLEFLQLAPVAELLQKDISADLHRWSLLPYRNYSQVIEKLYQIAKQNPGIAKVIQYGQSKSGNPLVALKISDNVEDSTESEPALMLTAATHGDEIITTEVLLELLDEMVNGYGSNPRFERMINGTEIYFIPVVNPDGFIRRSRYDNGVDPNRSYPFPGGPTNSKASSCIAPLIEFFESVGFAGSIDIHAYGELVMYPWGYTKDSVTAPDVQKFDDLAAKVASTNSYTYGPIATTIYVAKGSSADYYYWKRQTRAIAIEVGTSKAPSPDKIPSYVDAQRESTWLFVESFLQ